MWKASTLACIEALDLRPSTRREWSRLAKAEILPAFGARQAADLSRADIRAWAEAIRDGKRRWRQHGGPAPYTANRAHELLRRVFSWGVGRDLLAATPFAGLEPPATEEQSERVLSRDELRAVVLALDSCPRTDRRLQGDVGHVHGRGPSAPADSRSPGGCPRDEAEANSKTSTAGIRTGSSPVRGKAGRLTSCRCRRPR